MIKRNRTDACVLASSLLAAFLLFIGLPLAYSIKQLVLASASATWPSVNGEVIMWEYAGPEEDITVPLAYTYYVNDQRYVSGGLSYGPATLPPELQEPSARLELLPVGTKVTVYYDPDRPSTAVLFPGNGYDLRQFAPQVAVGLMVVALLLTLAFLFYRLWRPDERRRFPGSVDHLPVAPPAHLGKGAKP